METMAVGTVTVDTFKETARNYRSNRKIVDALIGAGYGAEDFNPHNLLMEALSVIAELEVVAENGASYTPDKAQGFGSDNSAVIAESVLGRRRSSASIKSAFSKLGA